MCTFCCNHKNILNQFTILDKEVKHSDPAAIKTKHHLHHPFTQKIPKKELLKVPYYAKMFYFQIINCSLSLSMNDKSPSSTSFACSAFQEVVCQNTVLDLCDVTFIQDSCSGFSTSEHRPNHAFILPSETTAQPPVSGLFPLPKKI